MDDNTHAYDAQSDAVERMLGTAVSPEDPDRVIIEPWAASVSGPILDVGSGTGRWTGHLASLGHDVTGLEPAEGLIRNARDTYPGVEFWHGSIAELRQTETRWAGMLAWYSIIHMGPAELPGALAILRAALEPNGTLLMSFFSGFHLESFAHPVTTAYRWPMADMTDLLNDAGFEVTTHHWEPPAPHAYVIACPTTSEKPR